MTLLKNNNLFEVNPLDYNSQRRVDVLYPHFYPVYFELHAVSIVGLVNWVYENTQYRFFFGQRYFKKDGGSFEYLYCAGFESQEDQTFFSLKLPDLNQR